MSKTNKVESPIATDESLAKILANNLTLYRKSYNLTQLELAEKLNYSDKSISKWERGEGIPDVVVLHNLARLYDTTIDALCSERTVVKKRLPESEKLRRNRRILFSFIVCGGILFLAAAIFAILTMATEGTGMYWLAFIYALPVMAIVVYVFNIVWGNRMFNVIVQSFFGWTFCLSIYLSFLSIPYIWLMFVLGSIYQVIMLFWLFWISTGRNKKNINKIEK